MVLASFMVLLADLKWSPLYRPTWNCAVMLKSVYKCLWVWYTNSTTAQQNHTTNWHVHLLNVVKPQKKSQEPIESLYLSQDVKSYIQSIMHCRWRTELVFRVPVIATRCLNSFENIGFLIITCPDPLNNHKATKPACNFSFISLNGQY